MFDKETRLKLGRDVRAAREKQGLTQEGLAQKIRANQSQISDLESGKRQTIGEELIRRACEVLGIPVPDEKTAIPPAESTIALCPNPWCPGTVNRAVPKHVLLKPHFQNLVPDTLGNCPLCGKALVRDCEECETPVEIAICCAKCGQEYVEVPKILQNLDTDQLRQINQSNCDFLRELKSSRARGG